MSLSDEELTALAERLAPLVTGKTEQPKQQPKEEPKGELSLVEQLAKMIDEKNKDANSKVFETLWEDKLNSMFSKTRGLEDFMKEEDDYGVVRMDRLKDMPFEERVKTAQKLEEQYRKAVGNGTAMTPHVNAKTQELAETNEKKYNEVEEKMKKNEYSSIDELQADFFDALSSEMSSVLGN